MKKKTNLIQSQNLCAETKRKGVFNHNDMYYIENQKRKVSNTDTGKNSTIIFCDLQSEEIMGLNY